MPFLYLFALQGCQAVAVKDPSNKSVLDYLWAGWQAALPRVRIPGTVAAATANGHAVAIATANGGRAPDAGTMLDISRLILTHTMCDVNSLDLQGMRPLHWAVALEQPALVKILAQVRVHCALICFALLLCLVLVAASHCRHTRTATCAIDVCVCVYVYTA